MRRIEIIVVIIIVFLGVVYTFDFGSLIASDHMAGILGVPFLFFLVIFSSILIFSKKRKTRERIRIILTTYLLTLISYSITILILRSGTDNAFDYLYRADIGNDSLAGRLLNWYCTSGLILCVILLFIIHKIRKTKKIK